MTSNDDNPLTHARTTYTNIFEKIFFGPYWVNYHVEHHAYMFVPCYRLKALHKEMIGHHEARLSVSFKSCDEHLTLEDFHA